MSEQKAKATWLGHAVSGVDNVLGLCLICERPVSEHGPEQQAKAKPLTPEEREDAMRTARLYLKLGDQGEPTLLARFALAEYEGRKEAEDKGREAAQLHVEASLFALNVLARARNWKHAAKKARRDRDSWKGKAEALEQDAIHLEALVHNTEHDAGAAILRTNASVRRKLEAERDSWKARAEEAEKQVAGFIESERLWIEEFDKDDNPHAADNRTLKAENARWKNEADRLNHMIGERDRDNARLRGAVEEEIRKHTTEQIDIEGDAYLRCAYCDESWPFQQTEHCDASWRLREALAPPTEAAKEPHWIEAGMREIEAAWDEMPAWWRHAVACERADRRGDSLPEWPSPNGVIE